MRTKHILTALAVPMVFAACTDEQFEKSQSPTLANRPMVGQVTFVEDDANTRLADPTTGAMTFKDGDKFGMVLMDEKSSGAGNANIGTRKYDLVNKAYTNYPFTKNGETWKSEAQLMEGNYFYYMPYTDNQSDNTKTRVTRDGGLQWVISPVQNAFTADAPTVLAPYNAVAENQLYVGYEALDSENPVTTLTNKMIAVHATMGFKIVNNDASDITVKRVVLEYAPDAGVTKFNNEGNLNVAGGKAKAATGVYTILVDGTETPQNLAATDNLAKVFKLYNADVKGNRNDFTKNPLMLSAVGTPFVDGTPGVSSIALNFPVGGYKLASGASVFAQMVVPAGLAQTGLRARVYTNKGVTLLPIEADGYTTELETDVSTSFVQGDVKYVGGVAAANATATVTLKARNENKQAEYADVANAFTDAKVLPNAWNVATLGVKVAAIQVPKKMNIYSTEDLDAFLGYCTLNPNVSETGADIEAVIEGDDVELSKEAYAVLQGNAKIELTINSRNKAISIPNTIGASDVLTRIIWAVGSKAIVSSDQNIAVNSWDGTTPINLTNLTITNTATLTISNFTGPRNTAELTTLDNLYNQGTLVVKSLLTADGNVINGFNGALAGATYQTVNTSAVIDAEANITADNIENIGTINVNDDVVLSGVVLNGKITKPNSPDKVGRVVVAEGKQLKTSTGAFTNNGDITLDGELLATSALTNNGTIENNFGLDVMTGVDLDNNGRIDVSKTARFTSVSTNTGTVEILARNTEVEVKSGNAGKVVYTAVDEDFESGVFTVLPTDRFNTLALNKGATVKPATTVNAGVESLVTGVDAVMAKLTLQLNVGEKFRFHTLFEAEGLEVATNKYAEIASDLKSVKKVTIKNGATLQNNTNCKFTYNGYTVDFKNAGTFRNLGTLKATSCARPATGTFTGSGTYVWLTGTEDMVHNPEAGHKYNVTTNVVLSGASGAGDIELYGAGTVTISNAIFSEMNTSSTKISIKSSGVRVVVGSAGSGDQVTVGDPSAPAAADIDTQIPYANAVAGSTVQIYYVNEGGAVSTKEFTYGASSWE